MKIGISLSGGGARGSAHIGVLSALLNRGIEPTSVAGTSAGSIVGALYAAGFSTAQMMEFVKTSKMIKLVNFGLPTAGITKLTYLKDRFREFGLPETFEELKRPFHVAITNLNTGELEIRSSGPLYDVVMASCSIPLIFEPVEIDGHRYVDGGVLCNLPVSPLREECDFVIGVNVIPQVSLGARDINGFTGVMQRCFDLAILANTRPEADGCDFYLEPERIAEFEIYQLNRAQELYELGYQVMAAELGRLKERIAEKQKALSAS